MRVLVTNLPGVKSDSSGTTHYVKAGSRWPMTVGHSKSVDYYPFPFWLAYASSLLKRDTKASVKGLDGVVLDMTYEDYFEEVAKERPDLLITELTSINLPDDIGLLKRINSELGTKIAIAGNFVTVNAVDLLTKNQFIDFAFVGEYELTAKDLVVSLINGASFKDIPGLVSRHSGKVTDNGRRPLNPDLDILPFPDREDFPATLYPDFTLYSPCINIISSRGCPGGCVYCQERHIMYNSPIYRTRSAKDVVDEMEFCIKKYGARQFYFDDQSFTVKKAHTLAICDELIRRGVKIPWTCMGDAMFSDKEMLSRMRQAGCIGMKFGIESANPAILKRIGKPLDLEKAKQVVRWCRDLGIRTHATFCIGLPGDTKETVLRTMAYASELGSDTAQVSKAIPYPGTPFYKWAKENNYLVTDDLGKYDGTEKAVLSYPELSNDELDQLYAVFSKKVTRNKIVSFISNPAQTFSIIVELSRKKGVISTIRTINTVFKRAI